MDFADPDCAVPLKLDALQTRIAAVRSDCIGSGFPADGVPKVHFERSVFCFEMTSSFDFTTPDFGIPDYRFPILLLTESQ
jgi:hypothetical protein